MTTHGNAQTGNLHLDAADERLLRQRYLHHSATWKASGDDLYPLAVFYVNRPTEDGQRVILPNEDSS